VNDYPTVDHFGKEFNRYETQEMHESHESTVITDVFLDGEFRLAELDYALDRLSKNKSPGSDMIPNETWLI
jgi:hypothetical protein